MKTIPAACKVPAILVKKEGGVATVVNENGKAIIFVPAFAFLWGFPGLLKAIISLSMQEMMQEFIISMLLLQTDF